MVVKLLCNVDCPAVVRPSLESRIPFSDQKSRSIVIHALERLFAFPAEDLLVVHSNRSALGVRARLVHYEVKSGSVTPDVSKERLRDYVRLYKSSLLPAVETMGHQRATHGQDR